MAVDHVALVAMTRELVRIPSVHDPARGLSEHPAAEWVARQLAAIGATPVVEPVMPGRPNVHAVFDGRRDGPTILFEGHTDVVTEGDAAAWRLAPFEAALVDGRIHGRGAADMKGGLCAAIAATAELCRRGFSGRIVVAALCDEEGLMAGAKAFVERGHLTGVDGVICCEPEGGEVCTAAKGALRLRVDFHGVMAHGAMPFKGINPNRAIGRFLADIDGLERALQRRTGEHPTLGLPWITPTAISAGEVSQMNVIPALASVWLDVRTVPGVDHGALVDEITALGGSAGAGVSCTVSTIDDRPVVEVDENDPLVRAISRAHWALHGRAPVLGGVPGATDGTIITSRTGVPSVVCGPGDKWIAHQVDEHVEVDDLVRHAELYVEAAERFLRRLGG